MTTTASSAGPATMCWWARMGMTFSTARMATITSAAARALTPSRGARGTTRCMAAPGTIRSMVGQAWMASSAGRGRLLDRRRWGRPILAPGFSNEWGFYPVGPRHRGRNDGPRAQGRLDRLRRMPAATGPIAKSSGWMRVARICITGQTTRPSCGPRMAQTSSSIARSRAPARRQTIPAPVSSMCMTPHSSAVATTPPLSPFTRSATTGTKSVKHLRSSRSGR